ncbi:MAG: glycosyltransferase [Saprospiraceae bacterium]|nr:glycosyltransferase [Saprospiraceae bacterium]
MANTKKIVCTVTNDLSNDQRMLRICQTLATAGFQVTLVGRNRPFSKPLDNRDFHQKRLNCWFEKGKFFYLEFNIRLFFFLLFHDFDIVNTIDLDTILPCLFVSKIKTKKIVFDAHEYFSEVPEVVNRPRIKKIWENIGDFAIPKMDACYTVGNSLAQIFSERYKVPFSVIKNVPFQTKIKKTGKSETKIMIYQGALNEGRGLEQMINALKKLPTQYVFWIVGDGDLSDNLKKQANELELGDQVVFWGMQSIEDLKTITLQADVGINLLENKGLSYYYSLANKSFDYIQANLPAINIAFPEYISLNQQFETSILCHDLSEQSILGSIEKIFDTTTYLHLQQQCEDAAKVLNWEHEKEELLRIYAKL